FISDRHKGVGSDGMILICLPDKDPKADFRMRVFNPDGSEAEICGNAIRSTAKFLYAKGFTDKKVFNIETLGGTKELTLHIDDNNNVYNVTAKWGAPILDSKRIPTTIGDCVDYPLDVYGRTFLLTPVSMGNPHCAVYTENVRELDLKKYGSYIECSDIFPQKANIEFVEVIDRNNLFMRTWERNCGETLACGTGCCVATIAGCLSGRCDDHVTVHQLGGDIDIYWDRENDCIYMTGGTEIVFDGEVEDEAYKYYKKR
ncbi:MAG: diaminopimelate epimerase, partial [Clostridia bacterium]|nr:diaminopimelate epimerase [Clostridia bacterium]